ncbi:hypothetical protein MTO96_019720 [Rhipicephalus appendiculatus]
MFSILLSRRLQLTMLTCPLQVLCLLAALLGNAMAVYVPTYGLPVAGYPTVPAVSTIHATPVAALQTVHHAAPVTPTVHNVATPYGYRTTGVSYSHRVDAHPVRVRYAYGLTPYGLNYGYGLDAFGIPDRGEEVRQDIAITCDSSSSTHYKLQKRDNIKRRVPEEISVLCQFSA